LIFLFQMKINIESKINIKAKKNNFLSFLLFYSI
jgi:hypothetical protein